MESGVIKREPFSFSREWQACGDCGPFAPKRMFQWQALNDIPDHCVRITDDGVVLSHGYIVKRRPAGLDL